ncbi:hydrogenase nickel incorporation protein HypB [Rhodothermus profundi]|uniref:Hydrogenase nickel incorporation protein HypB n=1 Tax=Rhodothermus profundi TaxID=633813 RepID=A0A1M6RL09_9BACT|nr:hydrogenase nickel incorporation protein HypB [Rhodothermus profundi]SHK33110.1 Hydrogenase nickel incorporation protein HypB [Rhodothermus profundi]
MDPNLKIIQVARRVQADNDALARQLRQRFNTAGVHVVNLIAAPGAGKTSLICRTIEHLRDRYRIGVLEGDIAGSIDTRQVLAAGACDAVQINTGGTCHLEARMIADALQQLNLKALDLLFIENVGNLICPTHWDLGAHHTICLVSAAEGHDKPLKYPAIFARSDAVILNKIDLAPLCDFDRSSFYRHLRALTQAPVFELSCRTGEGLTPWITWLTNVL